MSSNDSCLWCNFTKSASFLPICVEHLYDYGATFNVVRMAIGNIFYIPYEAFCFIYTQLNTVLAETGDFM